MPAWSPDGRMVAFVTWSSEGGHIYRVRADGTGLAERLTRHAAFYSHPVYSPDGSKIVFVSGSTSDQLYSDWRPLDPARHCGIEDAWESEIGGLAPTGTLELRWIPADGGDSRLIGLTQRGRYPHFAGDPDRVYLTSRQGLISLRLDGFD